MVFRLVAGWVAVRGLGSALARADDLLFAYNGDVLPSDPSSGFLVADPCDFCVGGFCDRCTASIEDGKLLLVWDVFPDFVNYDRLISPSPQPLPPSLWVEWRFWSNTRFDTDYGCDGVVSITFGPIGALLEFLGDTVIGGGAFAIFRLPREEFRTYRFESRDGINFCYYVDGALFFCSIDSHGGFGNARVQFGGFGGCRFPRLNTNKWDFLRYGTMADGAVIVASDPPAGEVDANVHPNLDRFTITFDQPAYLVVDQVSVSVSGGEAPAVLKTRRLNNGPADVVEVVLDRPIQFAETTTFTFDDGVASRVVEYAYVASGACCFSDGACVADIDCVAQGGAPVEEATCEAPRGCCLEEGTCVELAPVCCELEGGTPLGKVSFCDGDLDGDGRDGQCGDRCPEDPFKIEPGLCGCGISDLDSDGDTVPDCNDQCEGRDDTRDFDDNDIPDCLEFFPIPTVSTWGLTILAVLLLIGANLWGMQGRRPAPA